MPWAMAMGHSAVSHLTDNHRATPQIGRESFTPGQRFLSTDEGAAVVAGFQRWHPYRSRLLSSVLGWGDLRSDAAVREFVSTRPFVAFWPLGSGQPLPGGGGHD